MVDDTEPEPSQNKILEIKAPKFQFGESSKASEESPLIPPDLKISPEVTSQVGEIVDSWPESEVGHVEAKLARELLENLLDRIDSWIPGEQKYLQSTRSAKVVRDALLSGQSDAVEVTWGTTVRGELENLTKLIQETPWYLRWKPDYRSAAQDAKEAQRTLKEVSQEEKDRLDWQMVTGDCLVTDLQAGNRDYVRKGVITALSTLSQRLGRQEYGSPEIQDKALNLVNKAVDPMRADLLYLVNKTIGAPTS